MHSAVMLLLVTMGLSGSLGAQTCGDFSSTADIVAVGEHGWAVTNEKQGSTLAYTVDGGEHWSCFKAPAGSHRLFFTDPLVGWLLRIEFSDGADRTDLFQTRDGGRTWALVSTVAQSPVHIWKFLFIDELNGWFIGTGERGDVVLQTSDGGRTFRPVAEFQGTFGLARGVFADRSERVWIVGVDSIFLRERGAGFVQQFESLPARVRRISIVLVGGAATSGPLVFSVGMKEGPSVLSTVDRGRTWKLALRSSAGNRLSDIAVINAASACAVGDSRFLYCTTNGGKSWTVAKTLPDIKTHTEGPHTRFSQILSFPNKTLWLRAENGLLFRSRDKGKTWQKIAGGPR